MHRTVTLRDVTAGDASHRLVARLDPSGTLDLEGVDCGAAARSASGRDEYEYCTTIRAPHVPELRVLLEIAPDEDLIAALEQRWSGDDSWELERRLRDAPFPVERFVV